MTIGILTQPLHDNYGGLLQAYALKTTLERLGHNVEVINRRVDTVSLSSKVRHYILRLLGRGPKFTLSNEQKAIISQHTSFFAEKYIKDITHPIYNTQALKAITRKYDCLIVGSDQCWRPRYSPKISNYFLDFLDDNSDTVAFSYAASFGVDKWELSEKDTKLSKSNIRKFRSVSVREKSAIDLCKTHLGVDAVHVLDPTMLLDVKDYITLADKEKKSVHNGNLLHYVLDIDEGKERLISDIGKNFKYDLFTSHQKKKPSPATIKNIQECIYPKVTDWLHSFMQAEFVITDSFHGTVFSILFNKPFLVVANKRRGHARFISLLEMLGLEERLIADVNDFDVSKLSSLPEIEWDKVNQLVNEKRSFSMNYLKSNLS